jgi:hypothetical protein
MKSHAFKRMQDGMRKILSLHTAVELSSICGCLQLKAQQKATTSIDQILKYAGEAGELDENRVKNILKYLWEGALWEYLHSIGHPIHTMVIDPKITILKLWEHGGFLEGPNSFVPHFISREVKRRNEWIQSEDIQARLAKIRDAQDSAKIAERKVVSEHDYTNILTYFNQMSNLRGLENNTREYLIAELEIARSRIDSYEESTRMLRSQLGEMEKKFLDITDRLNVQLAHTEFLFEDSVAQREALEVYLVRTNNILQTYIDNEENREEHGGGTLQPMKLRGLEKDCPFVSIKELNQKLQLYRNQRNDWDDSLRKQSRDYVDEIHSLKDEIAELTRKYNHLFDQYEKSVKDVEELTRRHVLLDRKDIREEERLKYQKEFGWNLAIKYSSIRRQYEQEHLKIKPLLLAGTLSEQPFVRKISLSLLQSLSGMINNRQEALRIQENMSMSVEDFCSRQFEVEEKDRLFKLSLITPKAGKGGKGNKTPKVKKAASRDDQTVKTNKTEDSQKTGKTAASSSKGSPLKKVAAGSRPQSSAGGSRPQSASTKGSPAKSVSPAKKAVAKKK